MLLEIIDLFSNWKLWELCNNSLNKYWLAMCSMKMEIMFYWGMMFVGLLGIVMLLLSYNKSARFVKSTLNSLSNHILIISFVVWIFGVWIYIVGLYDCNLHWLAVIPRAVIASFKMFVVAHDLARVNDSMRGDTIYMIVFSVIHFTAAFITFLFVFKMIGYKIKSSFNIIWHNWFRTKGKKVHLFWGVNEGSLLLAEDIYSTRDGKETIIFIDVDIESDDASKKVTLSSITNTITIKDNEISRLDNIEALIDHCYNGPASVRVERKDDKDRAQDIFKILHLQSISQIVRKSGEVNIYFLSDDEQQNIAGALNMQMDASLRMMEKVNMYVHAHRGANNEIFDHYSQYAGTEQKIKIKLVDSAYLSIISLKQRSDALPVNYVKSDPDTAVVTSPFNAMVIGFGATGQEAFKFLYEFSAFIGPEKQKSPFKCYAVDANMDKIEGLVKMKMPAISDMELSMIKADVNSDKFWTMVDGVFKELNYVVIALNNDDIGLALAVNLYKNALMRRWGSATPLKIMVRCYESSNVKRFKEVIKSLNDSINGQKIEIGIFGSPEELYSCENILSNEVLRRAKEFNRIYTINGPAPEDPKKYQEFQDMVKNHSEDADVWWRYNFGVKAIEDLMKEKSLSRYHAIYEINRQISQNISNSLHCSTKMILMGLADAGIDELSFYKDVVSTREKKRVKYQCGANVALLLENIANVEHERWVAAHKLMGYIEGKKDYVQKHHPCICPWTSLDELTQSYDYNIVDTTIKLEYEK